MIGCCIWLRNSMEQAGEQGIGVVADRQGDYRSFRLQARAFTPWQLKVLHDLNADPTTAPLMGRLSVGPNGGALGINVMMSVPLQFCPGCGSDLQRLIRKHREEFDRLADAHGAFQR